MGDEEDSKAKARSRKARKDALGAALDAHEKATGRNPLRDIVQSEQNKPMEDMAREYRNLVQECVESGDDSPVDHKRMDDAAVPVKKKITLDKKTALKIFGALALLGLLVSAIQYLMA
jgi:ribosomal protein L17